MNEAIKGILKGEILRILQKKGLAHSFAWPDYVPKLREAAKRILDEHGSICMLAVDIIDGTFLLLPSEVIKAAEKKYLTEIDPEYVAVKARKVSQTIRETAKRYRLVFCSHIGDSFLFLGADPEDIQLFVSELKEQGINVRYSYNSYSALPGHFFKREGETLRKLKR